MKYERGKNPNSRNGFKKGHKLYLGAEKGWFRKGHTPKHKGQKGLLLNTGRTHFKKGETVGTKTLLEWRIGGGIVWNKNKNLGPNPEHSKRMRGLLVGNKNPNWGGGTGTKRHRLMGRFKYLLWRKVVFERDNYTCQNCKKRGIYIMAHHLKSWAKYSRLRYVISNGLTLCKTCHAKRDELYARFVKREEAFL